MDETVTFNCPFCCNETFDNIDLLKGHISDVLNNAKCPLCSENFDMNTLLAHMEECGGNSIKFEEENTVQDLDVSTRDLKCEVENENLENPDNQKEFYCEICNLYFVEMKKHLTEYHLGQEVVVESQYLENMLNEDPDVQDDSDDPNRPESTSGPDSEQIFLEHEILNESGQFYTKKLTKINIVQSCAPLKSTPILEHMIFLDGIATVIEKDPNISVENAIRVFRCRECNLRFAQLGSYNKHVCNNFAGEVCDICSIHFTTKSALTYHKRKLHGQEKPAAKEKTTSECDVCRIVFPSVKSMNLHRKMHAPITKLRKIEAPATYNIVGKKIADDTDETFTCRVCGKEYNRKYEEAHMKSHNEQLHNCAICNRKFNDKNDLTMHAQVHGNEPDKISCGFCKKLFNNQPALNEHMKNECHDAKKYECNYCGRKFLRPHEKVKHERIHTGLKPHVCEICGKAFRVSYCLSLHLRTHSGIRPYHCETCGKRFKSHSVYAHHVQTHGDVRAYKCTFCPKTFKTAVQLAGHKNTHTKPFSCNVCNRPFATLYAVRLHTKSHERQNNLTYQCHVCGAIYARKFALRDHVLTHTELGESQTEEVEKKFVEIDIENEGLDVGNIGDVKIEGQDFN